MQVGILAFIDAANFNVSASVGIGGFNWIYPDTFNLLMQAKMTPAGDVFTAGQVQSLQDKSCMWDFGNDTWNGGPNGMMGQGFPLIAQFTSSLEYLSARV